MSPQVVILAGGLGTRLGSVTQSVPKPLVDIKGKPFLEWQILYLKNQGFGKFLILTGYKGDQIESHFGSGKKWDVEISFTRETTPLGTGGALLASVNKLDDRFLLMFGDSFLPFEGAGVMEKLGKDPKVDVVMVVYDNKENTTVPFNVASDREGYVVKYAKGTSSPDLTFVEAGVYGVRKSFLPKQVAKVCSFESDLLAPAIRERRVQILISPQRFYDIGTPERLNLFEERLSDYFPHAL